MAPHQSGEQSGELLEGPFSDVFEAVLWDVDGTLIDSEPVHYKCASGMLADYGYHLSEDEYNSLVGQNTLEFFELYRYKCPKFPKEKSNVELAEEAGQRFAAMVADAHPREGVVELVQQLKEWNIKITCVSNGNASAVLPAIKHNPLFHDFLPNVVTIESVTKGKPDPEPYLLGAKRLGVDPARCIVIEDSPSGATAGKLAGALVVAWPQNERLVFEHADCRITSLKQVPWERLFRRE